MNISEILKKENVGKQFRFVIEGRPSDKTHTITVDSSYKDGITYVTENSKAINIKQILKQNDKYKYQVEFVN